MANYELLKFATADELAGAAASAWLDEIAAANRAAKPHCVALSGGRIAQKFFTAAAGQANARKTSFERVHFFWADERCVPPTDPDSNFKLANERLLAPLNISASQIHRLRGELAPAAAVKLADEELRRFVPVDGKNLPVLDLIFLGLGEDGHVASLFPNAPAQAWDSVASFLAIDNSPKPPPKRISMSGAVLQNASEIWVFAAGNGKAAALHESLKPGARTPLARVLDTAR